MPPSSAAPQATVLSRRRLRSTPTKLGSGPPANSLLMSGSFVHKIIIAGCRCFASPLPSRPSPKRDAMSNENHQTSSTASDQSRRYLIVGALRALLLIAVILVVVSRDPELTATSSASTSPLQGTSASTATTIPPESKSEVIARLREILQIREKAFRLRDASLFDDVYSSSCSCLRAGRDAIAALKKEKVRWKGRSISIEVQSARSVNERLWEVAALFISDAFRIETEEGALVREAPAERLRYRFLLVRTSSAEQWRLGSATVVEGQG